jgi:hypothetical protein
VSRRQLVWIAAGILGLLAVAGALWTVFGTNRIVLTEAQIQERVNRQLPREVKGVTVERTTVTVADDRIALRVEVRAAALNQAVAAVAFARGTPRYDADNGEVFFDADDVKLENVALGGSLGSRLGGRLGDAVKSRLEGGAGSLIAAGVKAYLKARPVYRFKDDVKGVVLKATLRDVAIEGSTVAITVSVVNLTVMLAVFVVALIGVVVLIVQLVRHPAWGRTAST